ncbi:MAG: GNAT family N-acetyltransferase [Clostridiales bacterium]|nr:GNAT family N-acetyltransferase [Clostridiales bacterium]
MTIELRPFTEPEYHEFFRNYVPDPVMEPGPYKYNREVISRSFHYNYHVRENYAHYGIFAENRPAGCFQLKRIDSTRKYCEFGIILQNEAWMNRGIGTQAIRLGLEIAGKRFGIQTVMGDTSSLNHRMIRVFEKLGFSLVETVPDAFRMVNGQPGDRLVYEIDLTGLLSDTD